MKKLFVLFILLWGSLSFANDGAYYFNKGLDALNSGNYTQASELFKKSCDMGDTKGCYNLGVAYEHGQGVSQDYTQASELFKKSCDMGYAPACRLLKKLGM